MNRKKVGVLFIGLGILSIVYFINLFLYGITFTVLFAAIGVTLIFIGFVKIKYEEAFLTRKFGCVIKVIKIFIVILLLIFISIEGLIIASGAEKYKGKADYIVILGAGLWGSTPSLILEERLHSSLTYIKENPNTKIVLSGGQGPGETITEAEAMRRYLMGEGIGEERILIENKSTSTMENLKYSKAVIHGLDKRENLKILIVTSNFHMFRSKLLAERNGFTAYGYAAPIPIWLIPTYYVREAMAVVKSLVLDRM